MERRKASDFDQELLNLYDSYAHGLIERREFLNKASKFAVGGIAATALLESLSPNYALAKQVAEDDPRITGAFIDYASPDGYGTIRGYLVRPAAGGQRGSVVVVHENRGLNPYIEDVARRVAVAGFTALAPDGLTPLGGYPGTDEEGKALQRTLDRGKLLEDFIAAFGHLKSDAHSNGKVGGRRAVLRSPGEGRGRGQDPGAFAAALRRPRSTDQPGLAGLRGGAASAG
jgi:carboxymethylenebutenolidase